MNLLIRFFMFEKNQIDPFYELVNYITKIVFLFDFTFQLIVFKAFCLIFANYNDRISITNQSS